MKSSGLAVRRAQTGDRQDEAIQRASQDIVGLLRRLPFAAGRMISVTLTAGVAYTLNHGLGVPAAIFVARPNYDGTGTQTRLPVESATSFQSVLDQNNQLSIVCADAGTWDLWVYPRASKTIPAGAQQSP